MLVVAVASLLWWWLGADSASSKLKFVTAKADRGALSARVTATGTVSALVTVQVGSQVSGRVAQINVDFNSPVKKGDLIALIDPQLFQAALQQAQANLSAAQGNLEKAKAQARDAKQIAKRDAELLPKEIVSQSEYDTALANADAAVAGVAAAQGSVEQAKAGLTQAKVNLDYTKIVAPTDGIVISRAVDVGQTVAASLQAPTLFTIAQDLSKMQVDTNVAEADVGRLTPGMKASFAVDAFPSEHFDGVVRQIRNAPQTVQNVVTYDAVIDVDNPDQKLRPGMTANVTFVYAERADVLRVPNAALRFRPPPEMFGKRGGDNSRKNANGKQGGFRHSAPTDPDAHRVWVMQQDHRPHPVTVEVGLSDGSLTEITGGDLHEGDEVITDARGTDNSATHPPSPVRMF